MAEWHTVESARDQWVDAPTDEDDGDTILAELLDAAKSAVLAYAPALDETTIDENGYIVNTGDLTIEEGYIVNTPESIPNTYRMAQLMQARNIWNSSKASPRGDFDNGEYGLTSFPLDWQVRQLLRPKRGKPVIA